MRRTWLYAIAILVLLATWQAGSLNAAVSRLKVWGTEVLDASDLNAEFNNVLTNGEDLGWPATKAKDLDGQALTLDADADSSFTVDTDDRADLALGGVDLFQFDGTATTPVAGLDFIGRATGSPASIESDSTDSNVGMDFRDNNSNEILILGTVASAVNEITITGAAANNDPTVAVTGDDTNIDLNLVSKGSGVVQANGAALPLLSTANIWTATQTIVSTDAGAGLGPLSILDRNSASPATSDLLGQLIFRGRDSVAAEVNYADVVGIIDDKTGGSADGRIIVRTIVAGALAGRLHIGAGIYTENATGGDKGVGTINASNIYDDNVLLANTVAASQAEQETGTSTTVMVTPGTQEFHQSAAKVWVSIDSDATPAVVLESYNVTSITDTAASDYRVTIATDFSTADYAVVCTTQDDTGNFTVAHLDDASQAAGIFDVRTQSTAGATGDPDKVYCVAFGDQS